MMQPVEPSAVAPATPVEAADVPAVQRAVRDAVESGVALTDYGVAHGGLGHPPPPRHRRLMLRGEGMGGIEHDVRDLTARVGAGCSMGELQRVLGEEGQFLPVDADDDLSVSEVIVHHIHGPLRLGYGDPRDLLLGLDYVSGEGELIRVGGRTVKNVAGYDVTRLMVGSLGELGVITGATWRTAAIPPAAVVVELIPEEPAVLDALLPGWLASDAAPAWTTLMVDGQEGWRWRLGYLGEATGCQAQQEALEALVPTGEGVHWAGAGKVGFEAVWDKLAAGRAWRRTAAALVKVIVPPAVTGYICGQLQQGEDELHMEAHPAHGFLFVGGGLGPNAAQRLDDHLEAVLSTVGGMRIWHRRPPGAENIAPFAPPRPDEWMLRRLKRAMDPHGVLNPGRLIPPAEQ